jgi:hypothetical protein
MCDLWWTKQHRGRFSACASVSNYTNFTFIIIIRSWHNRLTDGRSAEWIQLDSISHYTNYKKLIPVILCTCSMVEYCCRNANSWSGKISFWYWRNLYSIAFSKVLLVTVSKLIGLYELTSSSGFQGFGFIIISATFRWAGKGPLLLIELHKDIKWEMSFLGNSFNILPIIKSYPGAFLALRSSCVVFFYYYFLRCIEFDWFCSLQRFLQISVDLYFEFLIMWHFVWFEYFFLVGCKVVLFFFITSNTSLIRFSD